jgi:hypothetical protein
MKHGDTEVTRLNSKFAQSLRETEALYKLKSTTLPCDQRVFYPTLANHQASITTYNDLRAWVNIRSVKDAKEQGVTHQQALELYFSPQTEIPPAPTLP